MELKLYFFSPKVFTSDITVFYLHFIFLLISEAAEENHKSVADALRRQEPEYKEHGGDL